MMATITRVRCYRLFQTSLSGSGTVQSGVRFAGGIVASVATRLACTVNKLVNPVIRSNLEARDDR